MQQYIRQKDKSRRWWFFAPIFSQLLLIFGIFSFILLANETQNLDDPVGGSFGDVELSPEGIALLESIDKMYLVDIYQDAAAEYEVPWEYLFAFNYVESTLYTNQNDSNVGAMGPMQFMPRTWLGWSNNVVSDFPGIENAPHWNVGNMNRDFMHVITDPKMIEKYGGYGVDGDGDGKADPYDERDAIFSAANYLASLGLNDPNKVDNAIYGYNHSWDYVALIKEKTNEFTQPNTSSPRSIYTQGCTNRSGCDFIFPLPETRNPKESDFYAEHHPKRGRKHAGIDLVGESPGVIEGDVVVATHDGEAYAVTQGGGYVGYGFYVIVEGRNGVKTLYAHLKQQLVPFEGRRVKQGEPIGIAGNSGTSSGAHLHYEIYFNGITQNPLPYLNVERLVRYNGEVVNLK